MFILSSDIKDSGIDELKQRWSSYENYLNEHEEIFPANAFAFATAKWHYDPHHHHCPHDSWVESVTVTELSEGVRHEHRRLQIKVVLFGAFHDGYLDIEYQNVHSYQICNDAAHHGDWLYDEVRISSAGRAVHEVELANGRWTIECQDILAVWRDA